VREDLPGEHRIKPVGLVESPALQRQQSCRIDVDVPGHSLADLKDEAANVVR